MAGERLDGLSGTDVPQFGEGVAGAGDEDILVGRVDADGHDVAQVIRKFGDFRARFDIPQHAGHVSRRGDDATVVDEATARKVAGVPGQFARDAGGALVGGDVVNRADVVQPTAGDEVSTGGVGTGHDPGRPERDGVDFVGGVGVPNDELPVLRGRDEVTTVGGPVHGVDLGQMALERAARLHGDARQGVRLALRDLTNCLDGH